MEPAGALALFFSVVQGMAGKLIPDEITVLATGGQVAHSDLDVLTSFAAIYPGVAIVLATGYVAGSVIGGPILRRLAGSLGMLPELDRVGERLDRYLGWMLCLSIFFPVIRHLVPYLAGIHRMPIRRYLLAFLPGSIIWSFHYYLAGYLFADRLDVIVAGVYSYSKITLVGLCAIAVTYVFVRQILRMRVVLPSGGMSGGKEHGRDYRTGRG